MFNISKAVIGGVWSFGKSLVSGVTGTISGIYKNFMKPILPMLFKFMITPHGAFLTGYLSHMVASKVKKLFSKITGLSGKEIWEKLLDVTGRIKSFIGNIDFK